MLEHSRLDAERRVLQAITFIKGSLKQGFSLEATAQAAGLSPYYFSRTFKKITGETPLTFFRRERFLAMDQALREQPEESLTNLALEWGFSSSSALTREFYAFLGVQPSTCKEYFQDQKSAFSSLGETLSREFRKAAASPLPRTIQPRPHRQAQPSQV